MRFTVGSKDLFSRLKISVLAASSNKVIHNLDGVLLTLGEDLQMTASDLETTITTVMSVEGEKDPGSYVFPATVIMQLLNECPNSACTISVEGNFAKIRIASGEYVVPVVQVHDFPTPPVVSENHFEILSASLLAGIIDTLYAVGKDELRPIIGGICFNMKDKHLFLAATDIYRISEALVKVGVEDGEFILPGKTAKMLCSVINSSSDPVNVYFDEKNVRFDFNGTSVVGRRIDGKYPNYKAIIPTKTHIQCVVKSESLLSAVKRIDAFTDKLKKMIELTFSQNEIKISAKDVALKVSGEEKVPCKCTGDISILFKASFLIESLSKMTEDVEIGILSKSDGVTFRNQKSNTTTVIVPMNG